MEKRFFNVQLLLAGAIALVVTSCLGESENSRSATGEFVYITSLNGTKAAVTYSGALVSDELNSLSEGDCALIDYKVNFEKTQGSAYVPEYLKIDLNNVFRNGTQHMATASENPYEYITKNDIFVRINSFIAFSPIKNMGDRWLFEFTYKKYEGEENPQLQIFYNPNDQPVNDADKGLVTLDLALSRIGGGAGSATLADTTMRSVVNFSNLREILASQAKEDPNTTGMSVIKFRFRYPIAPASTTSDKDNDYELYTTPVSNSYYLIYGYEQE